MDVFTDLPVSPATPIHSLRIRGASRSVHGDATRRFSRLFTPRPKQINPYGKRTRTTDRERDVRFRTAACSKHEYPKTDGTSRFTNRIGEQPGPIRIRSSGVKDARMCRPTRGRLRGLLVRVCVLHPSPERMTDGFLRIWDRSWFDVFFGDMRPSRKMFMLHGNAGGCVSWTMEISKKKKRGDAGDACLFVC